MLRVKKNEGIASKYLLKYITTIVIGGKQLVLTPFLGISNFRLI